MKPFRDSSARRCWQSPHELIDHIVTAHHDHIRLTLPDLDLFTERIAGEQLTPPSLAERLQSELVALSDRLETHIGEQESWLFPLIRHMDEVAGETEWSCELGESIEWLMDRMTCENAVLLDQAEKVQTLLRDDAWAGNESLRNELAKEVRDLCKDLPQHARLEKHVLFPWVKEVLKEEGLVFSGPW